MATVEGALHCADHVGKPAVARCDRCAKPFCLDCRVENLATDEVFCSGTCREHHSCLPGAPPPLPNHILAEGYTSPIRTGWRLYGRSLLVLAGHAAPIALAMALLAQLVETNQDGGVVGGFTYAVLILALGVYGVAVLQVVVTWEHTRHRRGNAFLYALRGFLPWLAAAALATAASLVAMIALIIPGIYVSLRLFWADEFALLHGMNPVRAVKESWRLTKDEAGSILVFQFLTGLAAYLVIIVVFVVAALLVAVLGLVPGAGEFLGTTVLFWSLLMGYAGIHCPEVACFYGLRAQQSAATAGRLPTSLNL